MKFPRQKKNNTFDISLEQTFIKIQKNNGDIINVIIDLNKLGPLKNAGIWYAAWNKKTNSYIAVCNSPTVFNKKGYPIKLNMANFILNIDNNIPIIHKNGNTLDNRSENLEILKLKKIKNRFLVKNDGSIEIYPFTLTSLKSKPFIISKEDKDLILNRNYLWTTYKKDNISHIVANTPNGRLYLKNLFLDNSSDTYLIHANKNFLDFRRENIKIISNKIS